MKPIERQITLLANEHCKTGENPLWDPVRECVYWTDIPKGRLYRYDLSSRTHTTIYGGAPVGGFTLQADGSLLLFRVNDIAVLPWEREAQSLIPYHEAGMERFNDVIADPEGRVYAGTIGINETSGGLYRVDCDGCVTKIFGGTGCANGSAFSPDLQAFYWTCSTRRQIFRFPYDRATGALSEGTVIYQATAKEGLPDGLTVDREGNLWSARWNGWTVVKHAPDGRVLERLEMPVRVVTSACFGGRDLDLLFVTTANGEPGSASQDGGLFCVENVGRGSTEFRSRLRLNL